MGFRLTVLAVAAALLSLPAAAGERSFLAGVDDLPLAPGLVEQTDGGMIFDTPAGRIVEAHAEGAVPAAEVEAFYAEALPELGWRRQDAWRYGREDEVLTMDVTRTARGVSVRFTLRPER